MSKPIPKVVVFDIGGVLVRSPFQAIAEYELSHDIPPGYINFAISGTAPDGAWQRLERGEIALEGRFFQQFRNDLDDTKTWSSFLSRGRGKAIGQSQNFQQDARKLPSIDAEDLFWSMMMLARTTDPDIYPAAQRLKKSRQFVIVALSNTVRFPDGHLLAQDIHNFRGFNGGEALFDVLVSSADVGMRKPEPAIYEFAMAKIQEFVKAKSEKAVENGDVLFLDDIGSNLRVARARGWKTIKINLGEERKAVEKLEEWTKMSLLPRTREISRL
jgi:FMN phosphatase YigB (HAD superfamily)